MSKVEKLTVKAERLVKANLAKYDARIKERVLEEAHKKGYEKMKLSDIKRIDFQKLELPPKDQQVSDIKLGKMIMDEPSQVLFLKKEDYTNNSPSEDETVFSYSETKTDSWHWEIKAGVTVESSGTVKIPEIAEITESVKYDFSASYGEAHSKSRLWEDSKKVKLPAFHRTFVDAILYRIAGKVPFSCEVYINGKIHCKANIKYWGERNIHFVIPIEQILRSKAERTFRIEGEFVGLSGVEAKTEKESIPLTSEEIVSNSYSDQGPEIEQTLIIQTV